MAILIGSPAYEVASIGNFGLIDLETPADAYTITSLYSGREMKLVFSDEFNTAGRTFYPGDDPYWEAVDLHYWSVSLIFFLDLHETNHDTDKQHGMVWQLIYFSTALTLAKKTKGMTRLPSLPPTEQ